MVGEGTYHAYHRTTIPVAVDSSPVLVGLSRRNVTKNEKKTDRVCMRQLCRKRRKGESAQQNLLIADCAYLCQKSGAVR